MNSAVGIHIFRFVALLLLQGLILKRISEGWMGYVYFNVLLYPLFVILLPLRTPRAVVTLTAFLLGIGVDLFYGTIGLHAGAIVFTAYARSFVLNRIEPREGYNVNYSPTKARMGLSWFLRYASIMMGIHLLVYFSLDAFSYIYFGSIVVKSLYSFFFSMFFIIIVMFVFNPED
jgi:hypothetical protein